MKKLLTIIFLAILAVSAFAEQPAVRIDAENEPAALSMEKGSYVSCSVVWKAYVAEVDGTAPVFPTPLQVWTLMDTATGYTWHEIQVTTSVGPIGNMKGAVEWRVWRVSPVEDPYIYTYPVVRKDLTMWVLMPLYGGEPIQALLNYRAITTWTPE